MINEHWTLDVDHWSFRRLAPPLRRRHPTPNDHRVRFPVREQIHQVPMVVRIGGVERGPLPVMVWGEQADHVRHGAVQRVASGVVEHPHHDVAMAGLEGQTLAANREQLARYREHVPEGVALRVDLHERLAARGIDELHQHAVLVQVTGYHQQMPGERGAELVADLEMARGDVEAVLLGVRLDVHVHVGGEDVDWPGPEARVCHIQDYAPVDGGDLGPRVVVPGRVHAQVLTGLHGHTDGARDAYIAGVALLGDTQQALERRVDELAAREVHHDQVMHQAVRQLMAVIVEQVDAEALEPAVHRKRELLHWDGRHVHHHPGHFRAHGHAVGTAGDQDAAVRRVDLHM